MLNRHSYVRNNPLNATDPTGFFLNKAFKAFFRFVSRYTILGRVESFIYRTPILSQIYSAAKVAVASYFGGPAAGAAAAAAEQVNFVGYNGGDIGEAAKGAAIAVASAAASYGIGFALSGTDLSNFSGFIREGARAAAHGAVQGGLSKASGGTFRAGFCSGAFGSFAGSIGAEFLPKGGGFGGFSLRVSFSATAGGVGSVLGGGKFQNGAITAAFVQIFNHEVHNEDDPTISAQFNDDGELEIRFRGINARLPEAVLPSEAFNVMVGGGGNITYVAGVDLGAGAVLRLVPKPDGGWMIAESDKYLSIGPSVGIDAGLGGEVQVIYGAKSNVYGKAFELNVSGTPFLDVGISYGVDNYGPLSSVNGITGYKLGAGVGLPVGVTGVASFTYGCSTYRAC